LEELLEEGEKADKLTEENCFEREAVTAGQKAVLKRQAYTT